ncbi:MAG: hypothetical protein GXO43_03235 [Crenarchaeota archaeon]|nr:hypothetical protein [Thermoproteota archaeon]
MKNKITNKVKTGMVLLLILMIFYVFRTLWRQLIYWCTLPYRINPWTDYELIILSGYEIVLLILALLFTVILLCIIITILTG